MAFLTALLVAAGAGAAIVVVLRATGAAPTPWPARPGALLTAGAAAAVTATLGVAWFFHRRAGTLGLLTGAAVVLTAASVALAFTVPAPSFLTLIAALAMGTMLLGRALTGAPAFEELAAAAGALAAALVVLPPALLFHDGLGVPGLPVAGALLTLVVLPFAPLFPAMRLRAAVLAVALGVTLGSLTVATTRAPYSDSSRRPLNLVRLEDGAQASFVAEGSPGPLPRALAQAASWQTRPVLPWAPALPTQVAPAGPAHLVPPRLVAGEAQASGAPMAGEVPLVHGARRVQVRLVPGSGGERGGLAIPDGGRVERIAVAGWALDPGRCTLPSGWLRISIKTLPPAGVPIDLVIRGAEPLAAVIDEQILGLPGDASGLAVARGALATPIHDGDRTVLLRRVEIP
jgi:hypothetical protein